MGETSRARKERGAFFTPPAMADFLVRWTIRSPGDSLLEPSCGDASFLVAAIRRLKALGAKMLRRFQLRGVELHAASAALAGERVAAEGAEAEITVGDFFDFAEDCQYDAVAGNPPYIRYQGFSGPARAKALLAARAQGVHLSKLASSWAAFVVHAASFVKPKGRLALVLPAELLTVNYAAPVRRFLLQRFRSVRLITFEELVFPGVLEEVVLLLAEGTGPTDHFELLQVRNLHELENVDSLPSVWAPADKDGKWTLGLLSEKQRDTYVRATSSSKFGTLHDWGETSLGMVSGNNQFFAVSVEEAKAFGLRDKDLLRISPPGSKHLRNLSFSNADWERLAEDGKKVYLFSPEGDRLSAASRRKVADGEKSSVHTAFKCRVRKPWWGVPKVKSPDLFLTYMNHVAPRLCTNRARVPFLNSVHGVYLKRELKRLGEDLLSLASLNTLTLLGAEIVGRAYGGGMLKLEPKEADILPVPSPALLEELRPALAKMRAKVERRLKKGDIERAVALVDEVILKEGMGLSDDTVNELRAARRFLFARREARGGR